jgi:hypothetical protein
MPNIETKWDVFSLIKECFDWGGTITVSVYIKDLVANTISIMVPFYNTVGY